MEKKNQEKELPDSDHRKLGQELDLFSFHEISPGAPFWHHNGMILFRELETYARKLNDTLGYQEISTPLLVKKEVFEKSGHWKYYRDNMFWFKNPRDKEEILVVKPMNCPESTFVFNAAIRSYKDLPIRLAEIGRLNRNELSGTLGGLFRVRQITMDDAHIYMRPDQVESEIETVVSTIDKFYGMFGFTTRYVLATRPKNALGTKKNWELAERALENSLKKKMIRYTVEKEAGAFYGPKIEAHMEDSQGRDWQLGTAQLDIVMLPKQFELSYIDADGKKQMPWVIHRAIFGSFERFIGILLEHFNGALPFWLSPVQVSILTISDATLLYARTVAEELKKHGVRVLMDERGETIGKKIRESELKKIPYILVIGAREMEAKKVAVRARKKGDIGQMEVEEFVETIKKELPNI